MRGVLGLAALPWRAVAVSLGLCAALTLAVLAPMTAARRRDRLRGNPLRACLYAGQRT